MNNISINGQKYTAPSNWGEVQATHLLFWAKVLQKEIERTHAFALATMGFYKIKPSKYFKLTPAHHVQLKNTLSFLAEDNSLVNWLIETIKPLPWLKYYGPSARLSTSTIQEFRYAELYYLAYQKTKSEQLLDQLIATLYRKKGQSKLGLDNRSQLTQATIINNAAKMARLPKATRQAILFNYEGCRNFIFKKYPTVFKAEVDAKKTNTLPDLEGIIKTVAGGKFGNYAQTEDTPIYILLDHLADEIEEVKNRKK